MKERKNGQIKSLKFTVKEKQKQKELLLSNSRL